MICIGKLVNTHGIKGEVRIKSFYKEDAFYEIGNTLYIKDNPYKIVTYRKHKEYDMVTLEGINDINDALVLKGFFVYSKREDIKNEFIITDLIGMKVKEKEKEGIVKEIEEGIKYPYLVVLYKQKEYKIPYVEDVVKRNKDTLILEVEGLLYED